MFTVSDAVIEIEAGTIFDTTAEEIFRNLQVLYATQTGEQALDRDFGIDVNIIDCPAENTQALLAAEYVRKTERYEPRARVLRVDWSGSDVQNGILKPKVVIELV